MQRKSVHSSAGSRGIDDRRCRRIVRSRSDQSPLRRSSIRTGAGCGCGWMTQPRASRHAAARNNGPSTATMPTIRMRPLDHRLETGLLDVDQRPGRQVPNGVVLPLIGQGADFLAGQGLDHPHHGAHRLAASRPRRSDVHRRGCRDRARGRRAGSCAQRPPGLDSRHRPPHRAALPDDARSHDVGVDRAAGERRASATRPVEVAELSAPFSHQVLLLADALGLGDDVVINPSGGALAADPMIVTGLVRIGEAWREIAERGRHRVVAHATSGPCLQQNLVCVLEGDD